MQCKHILLVLGVFFVLCASMGGGVMADDDWVLSAEGPDGLIEVSSQDFSDTLSEYRVSLQVDEEEFAGIPIWRVLRLADAEKSLGPGDVVVIAGLDKTLEVPYPVVYKNDSYLLIYEMNGEPLGETIMDGTEPFGPLMYLGPGFIDGTQIGAVNSLIINEVSDWTLQVSTADTSSHITMDEWENLSAANARSVDGPDGFVFSGVQLKKIIELFAGVTDESSMLRITAQDGYIVDISWSDVAESDGYIIADTMNDDPLPKYITGLFGTDVKVPGWPLILVDPDFPGEMSVGNIIKIEVLN